MSDYYNLDEEIRIREFELTRLKAQVGMVEIELEKLRKKRDE
jgi:hypothetical protein